MRLSVATYCGRALAPLLGSFFFADHAAVQKLRLLIVEDSAQMRRLMCTLLGDMAEEIVECSGGREAVAIYRAVRPDWVLMDIHMPEGDGLTATREIRRLDGAARILIVTQFEEEQFRHAAAEAGAAGYVLKENLFEIRRVLGALAAAPG